MKTLFQVKIYQIHIFEIFENQMFWHVFLQCKSFLFSDVRT